MPTDELVKAVPPQALLINRMMVDTVVEAPNGAHFTTAEPDYGRDEKFQRHYAEAAGVRRDVAAVRRTRTCPAARPTTRPRCGNSPRRRRRPRK